MFRDIMSQTLDHSTIRTTGVLQECTEPAIAGDASTGSDTGDVLSVVVPAVGVNAVDGAFELEGHLGVAEGVAVR